MAEMAILDKTGDEKVTWNKLNYEEVKRAKEKFEELKTKGYLAFRLYDNATEDKGEQIDQFDPTIERILMVPRFVGG